MLGRLSELRREYGDYVLVEIGSLGYRSYRYVFIGFGSGDGVVDTNLRYWPKTEDLQRQYKIIGDGRGLLADLSGLEDGFIRRYEDAFVEDGSCYAVHSVVGGVERNADIYSPRPGCSEVSASECVLDKVFRFFEEEEEARGRYLSYDRFVRGKR